MVWNEPPLRLVSGTNRNRQRFGFSAVKQIRQAKHSDGLARTTLSTYFIVSTDEWWKNGFAGYINVILLFKKS